MTFRQVMELGASRVPVGITGEGQWVYETQDGAVLTLGENPPPVLMTILQLGEALGPALTQGLQRQGLDPSLAATFPVHAGVRLGLTWPTDFWQDLAVEWVEREWRALSFRAPGAAGTREDATHPSQGAPPGRERHPQKWATRLSPDRR